MTPFRALITTFERPDAIDDASEVYGDREIFDLLDDDNDCPENAGGHVWLRNRCVYCGHTP